jgi:hypothetical protein
VSVIVVGGDIGPSRLGDHAGVIGAAVMAIDRALAAA